MEEPLVLISLNPVFFLRLFVAFSWGIGYALFIQFHPWGRYLAEERTHYSVVIGIIVDLGIAFKEDWATIAMVITVSYIGIFIRSTYNERNKVPRLPNKTQWNLADITTLALDQIAILTTIMNDAQNLPQDIIKPLSTILLKTHRIKAKVEDARNATYRGPANA